MRILAYLKRNVRLSRTLQDEVWCYRVYAAHCQILEAAMYLVIGKPSEVTYVCHLRPEKPLPFTSGMADFFQNSVLL